MTHAPHGKAHTAAGRQTSALDRPLAHVLDALSLNHRQALALHNPDKPRNSLIECFVSLRDHGVPNSLLREMAGYINELRALNQTEGERERAAAAVLDSLDTLQGGVPRALAVKSAARALSPLLDQLAVDEHNLTARRDLDRVLAQVKPGVLTCKSFPGQLGHARYQLLLTLTGGQS